MTLHFADIHEETRRQPAPRPAPGIAARPVTAPQPGLYRDRFKRLLDVTAAATLLVVLSPLILLMAALIALDGHTPFYSQLRVGKEGRVFRIWKLRSMVHDADALLEAYLAENAAARLEWETTQKLKKDPRITFVGRVLRKTSADELPQLWNVLTGTMSLVGPRPMMVSQQASYPGKAYYRLRPGITGPWQVSDRNNCHFVDRAGYDDLYEQTLSLRTDLALLLRTVTVVLRGTGC